MTRKGLKMRIERICKLALERAIPNGRERQETLRFSKSLAERLEGELKASGIEAEVRVEGSVAKDTWLAGEKDIDIFMLLPKTYRREDFVKVLDTAKKVAGGNYLEAYAEHPYIEAEIEGYTVDFVPCFKIQEAGEALSSVDRTPLHTLYVKGRLNHEARDEVRLLKRFMRGIDTYGAEIKIGGFSGYLCEVLTLYYGSFLKILKAASDWREGTIIDLEGYYKGREEEVRNIFLEPLIVIDPVDKGRNVASAVRKEKLNEFIAASREFLEKPDLRFFYPSEVEAFTLDELARSLSQRGTNLILLKTEVVRAVPDVLWGQLYRSQRALRNLIRKNDFPIMRDDVWSDEENTAIFLFELCSSRLPAVKRHLGPPVEKREDSLRFLGKHLISGEIFSGPRIEGDRWVVEKKRRYTDAVGLLRDKLRGGGKDIGIASLVSQAFSSSLEILVDKGIMGFYSSNPDFALFLTRYLKGRPGWLR